MKISARNALKGKIVGIKKGAVMAQVTVDIGGGNQVMSAIFVESVDDLGLKVLGRAWHKDLARFVILVNYARVGS